MTEPEKKDIKILVADDTNSIRQLLKVVLVREGYTVIEAIDGQDALDKAASENPSLILLDIMMPKVYGWDVLQKIKTERPEIKIIVMTAVYKKSSYRRSTIHDLGADEFITKPFNIPDIVSLVNKVLRT